MISDRQIYAMQGENKPEEPYTTVVYIINDGYGNIIRCKISTNDASANPLYGLSNDSHIIRVELE